MRHIRSTSAPDSEWVTLAQDVLDQLCAAATRDERKSIIRTNSALWGELKPWLLGLSHEKCWFSEAKDCFSHFDVEHYRPKGAIRESDGASSDGYWWLAFDWKNFRICGNVGNRKKGSSFPLRSGSVRCAPYGDVRHEEPSLLDPSDAHDPTLLSFNIDGRAVPAAELTDDWEIERVKTTVSRYRLDFPPLMNKRKTVWAECWNRISNYRAELEACAKDPTNLIARDGYKRAASAILSMMQPEQELSAVARACVISTGDRRVLRLLQSA